MITPALASWYLSLVKDTSIASIIGLSEIVGQSQIVIAATVKPFQVYAVVAAAYFVICFPISLGVSRLERRSRPEKRGLVT
jgi:polar amino acid transport system permease protein